MSSNDLLYGNRTSGGAHGDVFTSPEVVRFMLDEAGYVPESNLSDVSILEPSCGEGEFVIEIAKRLLISAVNFDFDADTAFRRNVHAYDIDADKVEVCRSKIRKLGYKAVENIEVADFLKATPKKADIVVGNPPYIRYENIPEDMLGYCKQKFATFHYRSDLYVPFFEKSLSLLKEGGKHCFICSNRWLKNEYGKKLRAYIAYSYRLRLIVNMEEANAFQEDVLAYPAITLISAEAPKGTFQYTEVDDVKSILICISYFIFSSSLLYYLIIVYTSKYDSVSQLKKLSNIIGKENLVIRYDPIFISEEYSLDYHIKAFDKLCELLDGYVCKILIHFIDDYINEKSENVMAVSFDKTFVVSPDKTEEFLNVKPNPEIRQQQKEMVKKLNIQTESENGPVLSKRLIKK